MELSAVEQYWVWLSSVEGIGSRRFFQLIRMYGDARSVWDAARSGHVKGLGPKILAKLKQAAVPEYFYRLFDQLERLQITPVTHMGEHYSELLYDIDDAPPTLYVMGNADLHLERPFAIVGTRSPSRDGRRIASEFAERLALSGATVVSGLARGIDTCAHEGCLKGMGRTVAVLGCGVDVVYPKENESLYRRILESGGSIVSEYAPGVTPMPQYFPARNRIISGLSRGTLLVEGSMRSGGMITAGDAKRQGRDLFAVPGAIYSSTAQGPNYLLAQGAKAAISPWDIPENYGWAHRSSPGAPKEQVQLSAEERRIVAELRKQELTVGELSAETGLPIARLNGLLTMLEMRGIISKVPGGGYRANG